METSVLDLIGREEIPLFLHELTKPYDVIVSLGYWCGVAGELRNNGLRRFSGPLDWVLSPALADVSRLLKNRFQGFMELENMVMIGKAKRYVDEDNIFSEVETFVIRDQLNNITSVHDFPVIENQHWTQTYPSYKEKLNYRINRFFDNITNSNSVLFVRYGASYAETAELHSVLSQITNCPFHILVVNPTKGLKSVIEKDWEMDGVVSVEIPLVNTERSFSVDVMQWNYSDWNYILSGITVSK